MSLTVAQLKVVLEGDTARFEASIKTADNSLDNFAKKAKRSVEDVAASLTKLGTAFSIGVTAPLLALGKAAVDATVRLDSLKRGLTAVAGSSKEAEAQLVRLKEVARLPGLGFEEAIQGSIRLQAAGLSARQAEASLKAFGNALATVGKGKAELDGVTLALGQMASKGKVMAEEINQLNERVPQIRQIMLKAFGSADTEILQKAKITSKEFVSIITAELSKLPQVTGGLKNAFENAKDSINESLDRIGKAVTPLVATLLEKLVPTIERITKAFSELPKQTQELMVVFAAAAIAGGPIALLAGQILELGKAIGLARLAALGPVAGIATLLGVGAMAGLSAWNADSDRKAAVANTTYRQTLEKQLVDIDARRARIMGATTVRNGKPTNSRIAADIANLDVERNDIANRLLVEQTRNEERYLTDRQKSADAVKKQQEAAEKMAADARKRVQEAAGEAARKAAEVAAKKAEAEAERLRKLHENLMGDINKLTMSRYDFERYQANVAYQEAIRQGANKKTAQARLAAELKRIDQEQTNSFMEEINKRGDAMDAYVKKQAEVTERVAKAIRDLELGRPERTGGSAAGDVGAGVLPSDAELIAAAQRRMARRGFDIRTPDTTVFSAANAAFPGLAPLPSDVIPSRNVGMDTSDRMRSEARKRQAEAKAEIEALTQDIHRGFRRSSRNFLKALFGSESDRRDAIRKFADDIKETLVESLMANSLKRAMDPLINSLSKSLESGLSRAISGAVKVAESSVGKMLGAVYQLLSGLSRKGGLNAGNILGGIAGFALGGFSGAAYGFNAGGALYAGDLGGVASSTFAYAATGGFGKIGGGGVSDQQLATKSRSRSAQIIYSGPVTVNERADITRLSLETVRRLNMEIDSGTG